MTTHLLMCSSVIRLHPSQRIVFDLSLSVPLGRKPVPCNPHPLPTLHLPPPSHVCASTAAGAPCAFVCLPSPPPNCCCSCLLIYPLLSLHPSPQRSTRNRKNLLFVPRARHLSQLQYATSPRYFVDVLVKSSNSSPSSCPPEY